MIRKLAYAALASAAVISAGACAPVTAYHGFQAVEANPKEVKVGEDTKATVHERLGSPSAVASFEPNIWYYVSEVTDQVAFRRPITKKRDVVAIAFTKDSAERVEKVDTYSLKDGRIVSYNGRATPTRGREMTVLEQLLGNVGRQFIPNRELDPGDPRGNN
jgi:outer membrane protein assembly factor BamE (lipoprotein component of BamABCDE complex)